MEPRVVSVHTGQSGERIIIYYYILFKQLYVLILDLSVVLCKRSVEL